MIVTCLCHQVERYNGLLVNIRRSCSELVKGIKGLVVMSADLDQVGTAAGTYCESERK